MNLLNRTAVKRLGSKQIFQAAGVPEVPRTCRILQLLAVVYKPAFLPPLIKTHRDRRLQWAQTHQRRDLDGWSIVIEASTSLGWSEVLGRNNRK